MGARRGAYRALVGKPEGRRQVTLFRDVSTKEIKELNNYRTKFCRRNITASYFQGHFC
jgi:hypothetical protein